MPWSCWSMAWRSPLAELSLFPAALGPDHRRVNCINRVFCPDTGLSAEFAGGPVDKAKRQLKNTACKVAPGR